MALLTHARYEAFQDSVAKFFFDALLFIWALITLWLCVRFLGWLYGATFIAGVVVVGVYVRRAEKSMRRYQKQLARDWWRDWVQKHRRRKGLFPDHNPDAPEPEWMHHEDSSSVSSEHLPPEDEEERNEAFEAMKGLAVALQQEDAEDISSDEDTKAKLPKGRQEEILRQAMERVERVRALRERMEKRVAAAEEVSAKASADGKVPEQQDLIMDEAGARLDAADGVQHSTLRRRLVASAAKDGNPEAVT